MTLTYITHIVTWTMLLLHGELLRRSSACQLHDVDHLLVTLYLLGELRHVHILVSI